MDPEEPPDKKIIFIISIIGIFIIGAIYFLNISNKVLLFILLLLCFLFFFLFWDSTIKKEELDNFLRIKEDGIIYSLPKAPKEFP
jgi:uncharacterized membrane protein YfcA